METERPIPFAGNPLDRASDLRTDPEWLAARYRAAETLVWPFHDLRPLLIPASGETPVAPGYLPAAASPQSKDGEDFCVFLGLAGGRALFARDLTASGAQAAAAALPQAYFSEARAAAQVLPAPEVAILGQAKALLDWHRRHGYCPNCGGPTEFADGGYRRHCVTCGADHFPRTDPVVIMLALHGDACLVGRSPRFAEGMFSALAGFVEPGETIEEAVAREIHEEAGVRVRDVRYVAAQPWPFPSSLMIGCFAQADGRELKIDKKELAEAFWLEKRDLRALFAGQPVGNLRVPSDVAIAHHLLRRFAELP